VRSARGEIGRVELRCRELHKIRHNYEVHLVVHTSRMCGRLLCARRRLGQIATCATPYAGLSEGAS
jgi:hypothetical protein